MALHALLVAYLPNVRDSARGLFNSAMLGEGWRQYSIPFTWTKDFPDDAVAGSVQQLETQILSQLHAALAAAGSPTYTALLQLGGEPAVADPPGWDRLPGA